MRNNKLLFFAYLLVLLGISIILLDYFDILTPGRYSFATEKDLVIIHVPIAFVGLILVWFVIPLLFSIGYDRWVANSGAWKWYVSSATPLFVIGSLYISAIKLMAILPILVGFIIFFILLVYHLMKSYKKTGAFFNGFNKALLVPSLILVVGVVWLYYSVSTMQGP
ncbi:hypothetical protein KJ785_00885 [Patescibacteria group bacterium]|nr:hypothetical protein [Patescibacteria group bacterium]